MIGRMVAVAYVATVAALTARAFSERGQDHWGAEIAAAALTLPAVVVALPVIYVIGAAAWNVADSQGGGAMWPVTLTFTVLMTAVACANLVLLGLLRRRLRGSASASARTRSGA
jgi:hypothetical protein